MNPAEYARMMQILGDAIELPLARRASYLDSTCVGEPGLRRDIEDLLDCAEPSSQAFDEAAGQLVRADPEQIGPYTILEPVGEGGMAIVYRAQQHHPVQRIVAVKLVKLGMDTQQFVLRFEAERQALAMMDHPNVAKVFDAGATDTGRPYFVMEYVTGRPILEFCDARQLDTRQRLELFIGVCDAVEHAHRKGIIHRDIKNTNVLVADVDGKAIPKVIDFGVAKAVTQRLTERTLQTEQGQLIGTPEYMSPEQAERGMLDVDTRSDIYSLGVLLYELISGVQPIPSDVLRSAGYEQVQRIIRETEPLRPSTRLSTLGGEDAALIAQQRQTALPTLIRDLQRELEWIPLKALRKDREQRYRSAAELADDIRNYLVGRPLIAGPESKWYRAQKLLRRHRAGVLAFAAMLGLLIAGIAGTTWQAIRATTAQRQTNAALHEVQQQKGQTEEANQTLSAVNEFFIKGVIGASSPDVTRGKPLTVQEALENAARDIGKSLTEGARVKSAIETAIAKSYRELGRADLAIPHAQSAVELCAATFQPDDLPTLFAHAELGFSLEDVGRLNEAEPLLVDALERARRRYGSADVNTLDFVGAVGTLRFRQGRLREAESLCREALDGLQTARGMEDNRTLEFMNILALVLRGQGRLPEAEQLLLQAVQVSDKVFGEDHPATILAANTLSSVLVGQGKIAEAEPIKHDVLEKARRVLGEEHQQTIAMMQNLADLLAVQGKLDQAETLFCEALEKSRRGLAPDHHVTLGIANNYARLLDNRGKFDQAEPLFRQAVDLGRQARGLAHPDVIISVLNYARALSAHGRPEEAEVLDREALAAATEKLGPDHRLTLSLMQDLGQVLAKQGKTAEAEPLLRDSLQRRRATLGDDHGETLGCLFALGMFLMEQGRLEEAEPVTAELARRAPAYPRTLSGNLVPWGLCLQRLGRYEQADAALRDAHQQLTAAGARGAGLRDVMAALADVCDHTGRPDEAASWRAQLAELLASTQPTTNPR